MRCWGSLLLSCSLRCASGFLFCHLCGQVDSTKAQSLETIHAHAALHTHETYTDGIPHATTVPFPCSIASWNQKHHVRLCSWLWIQREILKTSLIYETAINSQRNPLTTAHTPCAAGCWLSWFVVRCGWVPTYVFVTGCSRCSLRIATLELSTHISWIFFFHAQLQEFNNPHMCCMFTKHGSLIKTSLIFIQTVCMVSFAYTHKSSF